MDLAESNNFKRKLSKREKKEFKKKEKLSRLQSDASKENKNAEKLYTGDDCYRNEFFNVQFLIWMGC